MLHALATDCGKVAASPLLVAFPAILVLRRLWRGRYNGKGKRDIGESLGPVTFLTCKKRFMVARDTSFADVQG